MKYLNHHPEVVTLVGMGPSLIDVLNATLTQEFSPNFTDEVWAINMVSNVLWHDVVFWMDDFESQQHFKPGLFEMLRKRGKPVISSVARPDIVPNSYDYPINEVSEFSIPYFGKPYLTNGVAMAIAYAMWKKVKVLKIYGCDFTYPDRNFAEAGRACSEAWITLASKTGMEVQMPPSTSLFDTVSDGGIYGYREQPEIVGPGGIPFKYVQVGDVGKYVATDSGGQNDVSGLLPRAAGRAAAVSGSDDHPNQAQQAAPPPTPRSGEGVRHPGEHGRAETGHPPRPNGGGEAGRLPSAPI